ncbi:MAG: hypothetical protein CMF12_06285 [Idiomarina sp.]|uniref:prepilin-type N-terminal cleavage/methylation domain-containing protein n=1 Tax=Idiomarina sp. TaxID=1874361 RepID=UPI000C6209F4|nr:prepilin-type N-terminal cleavage/methylation domain-containing protein [Idiomarina sp.]MBT42115.1 hypothetical protein [Idiomarina sp.]
MPGSVIKARGFTIVELIIIIVVVGILAVSAYPLIGGRSGVDVAAYQGQVMSLLRLQQQRAMQDTATADLYSVCVSDEEKEIALFKLPPDPDPDPDSDALCNIKDELNCDDRGDCIAIDDGEDVTFSGPRINFDTMGCPYVGTIQPATLCAAGALTLQIQGATTRQIQINEQGYIQALP